jgi:hypothetical protein
LIGACGIPAFWNSTVKFLPRLKERIALVFGGRELRETGGAFLEGLSGVERKTG